MASTSMSRPQTPSTRAVWQQRLNNPKTLAIILIVPAMLFFFIWNVIPVLWLVGLSFYRYSLQLGMPPSFVGIGNYEDLFFDFRTWESLSRTFTWVALSVGIETILGIVLGILFWGSNTLPGRRFALTLLFTPMLLTPVSVGAFYRYIYEPTFGITNYFLSFFGTNIDFLGNRQWAFASVLAVDIWMWTPFMTLITLAALGSVPKAELEAAAIDRLPWLQRFQHIILPRAKFILMLGVLLRTIESFKTMDLIHLMTKGGPGNATDLIALSLYRSAFDSLDMGESATLALVLLLTAIAFTSIYLYILNLSKREQEIAL
ncbi:MAG: sugar ABC transporter permease [Deinococcota bacterium]